ncbi:hypothetical protein TNCV_2266771 [Trichonephila clavipes]|nr:hypothetical protein TNCV_2266771 [Trichonephila clavipes]
MRPLEDAGKNGWKMADFSVMMVVVEQDNARPHTVRVAMNCLTACQTLPLSARSLSDRACLGYDEKATDLPGNVDDLSEQLENICQ